VVARFARRYGQARLAARLFRIRCGLSRRLALEPLDVLVRDLGRVAPRFGVSFEDALSVIRVVEPVVARCPWIENTCLFRALGRFAVLRSEGFSVEVLMGMGEDGTSDTGHAWILVDGVAFDADDAHEASRMAVTFRSSSLESPG